MKEEEISINYSREAFFHPVNLSVLLGTTLAAFFLINVDLLPNLILTFALGTELLYLGIVPQLPRFRQNIRLRKMRQRDSAEEEKSVFRQLDPKSQKQFLVLKHLSKLIKENFEKLPFTSQGLLNNIRKKIDELLSNYITLLDLYKKYEIYINSSVEGALKREVERLQEKVEEISSERLKNIKSRRLQILKKRLMKFEMAKEKYLICETHLDTIEDAIRYIYEQSMTLSNAEEIGFQLDNLMSEVEETSNLIEALDHDTLPVFDLYDSDIQLEEPSVDIPEAVDIPEDVSEPTGQEEQKSNG